MHGALKYFGNDGQYDTYSDGRNYTFLTDHVYEPKWPENGLKVILKRN